MNGLQRSSLTTALQQRSAHGTFGAYGKKDKKVGPTLSACWESESVSIFSASALSAGDTEESTLSGDAIICLIHLSILLLCLKQRMPSLFFIYDKKTVSLMFKTKRLSLDLIS